ncbi:MAG: hypothetical protein IPG76_13935 [Acidobacteria bacterium]|nr:hypothetical protein [Acidobacteriota bacterium]
MLLNLAMSIMPLSIVTPYLDADAIDRMARYTKEEPILLFVSGIMIFAVSTILRRKLSRNRRQQLNKIKPTT